MDFLNKISDWLDAVGDFISTNLYYLLTDFAAYWIIKATIAWFEFKIWSLRFAWDVAQRIIAQLNLASVVTAAWGAIDSQIANFAGFLHIPEAINIILGAMVTKYVLRFLGL